MQKTRICIDKIANICYLMFWVICMKRLFEFDAVHTVAEVVLAFSYTPRVMQNQILHRPHTGLLYVVRGSYAYTWDGGSFCAPAGSVIYLPPGSAPYSYSIEESTETVQVEFDLYCAETKTPLAYGAQPMLLGVMPQVKGAFEAVVQCFQKKDTASRLELQSALYALLAACVRHTDTAQPQDGRIMPALLYLQENYTKAVSVEKLATLCHLSPSQLRRLFRATFGKSPIAYKNALLLADAKKLLENAQLSIGEIADMLGFYDIYAFSHFFSAAEGIPPRAYRKERLDKASKA